MPAADTAKNDATGLFGFGEIRFDKVGTYEYTVTEVNEGKTGYTYDGQSFDVKIVVTDQSGALKATVSGVKDSEGESAIVFNNRYAPIATTVDISGTKMIVTPDGEESIRMIKEGEFSFDLIDRAGKVVSTAKVKADGTFVFEDVAFDRAGEYSYTVVEKTASALGITNDTSVFGVDVTVKENGGKLQASVSYPKGGVVFENTYKAIATELRLTAIKKLSGRELKAGEFTFELLNQLGEVIDTATNSAEGVVVFDKIVYESEGIYSYAVREVAGDAEGVTYDEAVYKIEVVVVDKAEGNLVATASNDGAAIAFENSYETPAVPGEPEEPKSPATGDKSFTALWIAALLGTVAVFFKPFVQKKKRAGK